MLPGSDRRDGGSGEREESRGWLPDPSVLRSPGADDTLISRKAEKKRGRPKTGEPVVLSYKIAAEIEHNPKVVEEE